jgi:hypothetical protein
MAAAITRIMSHGPWARVCEAHPGTTRRKPWGWGRERGSRHVGGPAWKGALSCVSHMRRSEVTHFFIQQKKCVVHNTVVKGLQDGER